MKKIIFLAAIIAFTGLTSVKASDMKSTIVAIQQDSTTKTQIRVDALPEPVKTTLKSDKYKDLIATTAYLVTAADKTQWYLVDVSNKEGRFASLKIGKDGVVVE
jgi:hypothetical protein